MAFYRFEDMEQIVTNPGLSSGKGAIIKGRYLTLRNNNKGAGTGSQLHYHPNELMVFSLAGKLNCVVGKDRRILPPGILVHMPSKARHSIFATEDGPVSYLYVKDNTWGLVGFAAGEAMSEEARRADAKQDEEEETEEGSIIEGLGECYYPLIDDLAAPRNSGERQSSVAGERMVFTFSDRAPGASRPNAPSETEHFVYVLGGGMEVRIGDEARRVARGDVLHVGRGQSYGYEAGETGVRLADFAPTQWLVERIDAGEA